MQKIITPRNDVNSTSVTLRDWLVADQSEVLAGQRVANVETAKAVYEIEAPCAGRIIHLRKVGEEVPYEEFIGVIAEQGETLDQIKKKLDPSNSAESRSEANYKATKKAELLAKKLGVDLSQVKKEGIISEADVSSFADNHNSTRKDVSIAFLGPDQYPPGLTRVVVIGAGNSLAQIVRIFFPLHKKTV